LIARFKMAGLHLLASILVVGLFLSIVYFIWYPYPYYIFHSTISATQLVVIVDLVLGPLLTFVVFNTVKPVKELKRDLAIIICIQISALLWGVHITHSVRPLFAVYFNGEIHSVTAVSFDESGFDKSIRTPGIFEHPQLVYIEPMENDQYRTSILTQLKGEEIGIVLQTKRYKEVGSYKQDMVSRSLSESQLKSNARVNEKLQIFLSSKGMTLADILLYPVYAGPYRGIVIVEKDSMRVIDVLDAYISNTSEYY